MRDISFAMNMSVAYCRAVNTLREIRSYTFNHIHMKVLSKPVQHLSRSSAVVAATPDQIDPERPQIPRPLKIQHDGNANYANDSNAADPTSHVDESIAAAAPAAAHPNDARLQCGETHGSTGSAAWSSHALAPTPSQLPFLSQSKGTVGVGRPHETHRPQREGAIHPGRPCPHPSPKCRVSEDWST